MGGDNIHIIIVYDVPAERTQIYKKTCRRFLTHVQNSVFEGIITEAQWTRLEAILKQSLKRGDSIRIYKVKDDRAVSIQQMGEAKHHEGNII